MNFGGAIRVNKFGLIIIGVCVVLLVLYYASPETSPWPATVSLKELLIAAVAAAEQGGVEVVNVYKRHDLKEESKGDTKEGVNVPVTQADFLSHCVMYYGLKTKFPTLDIISEEKDRHCDTSQTLPSLSLPYVDDISDERVDTAKVTVWIDPLDATKEFTEKLTQYVTTMVCVAVNGKPVIGVIHRPFYWNPAERTSYAWVNHIRSDRFIIPKQTDDSVTVLVSRSHAGDVKDILEPVFGEKAVVVEAGGSGYKSLEVAVSNASAYIHKTSISKWDICAGNAIILDKGLSFTSLNGAPIDYSSKSSFVHGGGLLSASISKYRQYLAKIQEILDIKPWTI